MSSGPESFSTVDPIARKDWDDQILCFPECSIFHTSGWTRVLSESYGYRPLYWVGCQANVLQSVMPMMEVDSYLTGKRGVSLPFTDECRPLGSDSLKLSQLFHEITEFGRKKKWKYVEFRGHEWSDLSEVSNLEFFGHELDLTPGIERLEKGLKSSVRRALRKAESSGVRIVRSTSPESVKVFYEMHCETRRKHGLPPQPYCFFSAIQRNILAGRNGFITTAYFNEKPVASAVFFHFGKRATFKFGASRKQFLDLRANNLVMWNAIRYCVDQGMEVLDFGRTSKDNSGLRRFKLGWGTKERTLKYFKYDLTQGSFVRGSDRIAGWYNSVFRLAPGTSSRLLSKLLYRHIG